jgi:SAM-dependent methyltransferase
MTVEHETPRAALAHTYDDAFYEELDTTVRDSAEVVVSLVMELVQPRSILDVGCGRGTWLDVFRAAGVTDSIGVDGPHIEPSDLEIPVDTFVAHDLDTPLHLARRFDLAMSLEVGEHLDRSRAPALVASLVAHAPVVLFSAAVPFQGGAGHVNEAWPSAWARHFATHDYDPYDVIRPRVWSDPRVAFWYAQNTILYVERAHARTLDTLGAAAVADESIDVVHPALHVRDHTTRKPPPPPPSLSRVLRDAPGAAWRAVSHRVHRPKRGN